MRRKTGKQNSNRWILWILVAAVLLAALMFFVARRDSLSQENSSAVSGNAVNSLGADYPEGYSDDCVCTEHERPICPDSSWMLSSDGKLCKRNNEITNVWLSCSRYVCVGATYKFNEEINEWETE